MADVVNLSKTTGERGAELRFLGGSLHGDFCFVPYGENKMEGMSTSHPVEQTGPNAYRVRFSMFGPPPRVDISTYRRLRIRLASPSAVLDEMVMVNDKMTEEQAKQELAKIVGLRLPKLHLFKVNRSSHIAGIAWDKETGTMDVLMVHGETYRYFNITDIQVMEFLAADSLGTYYNDVVLKLNNVKLGGFHSVLG